MRSIILLALLFGVLVTASPIERDDLEDEEQTPDSIEDEDLDELEKDSDDEQEDPEFDEDEDSSVSFSCVGKPGHKHDGTIIKYADPNDCHYWYECRQNQQMRFRCHTAGQIFDKDLQYCKPGTCNDVGEGFCAGKPGTKPDGTTIKYVHPDPKKCNYWVECREGKYREYRCHTQGQIFNKDLQYCVKGTCSQTIFDAPFSCVGKQGHKPDGTIIKYKDPTDCHHWYECRQKQTMRFKCHTAGQIFDVDLQHCKPGTCAALGADFCAGKPGTKPDGTIIKYAHPDAKKCTYWVECVDGKYKEYMCHTKGYIFNVGKQFCVKGTCSQPVADAPFSCVGKQGHKPDGTIIKYKDPTDCHHWYECRQKQTMRFKCHTAGQIFDVDLQHCKPGTCAALGADFCAGKPGTKPDGTIIKYAHPDAKKCTYWVECVDGKYKEYMCHTKGYIFNVGKQFCVKGTCSQPVANVSFSCVGKPGHKHDGTIIKYADPNDCHYWYECRQNQQMRFRCHTAGQIFDKNLQYCKPGTCNDVGEGFCAGKPGTKPDGTTIKYVHSDPKKCNYWVECREGKYREYRCHTQGQIFNKDLQYCVKGTCAHPSSDFIEDEILAEEDPDEGDDDPEKDIEEDEEDEEDEPIDDEIEIEHDFKE